MQTIPDVSRSSSSTSFSVLLSALTSRLPEQSTQEADAKLRDDVVSLSYEQALRTAARQRPFSVAAAHDASAEPAAAPARDGKTQLLRSRADRFPEGEPGQKNRMTCSITIRIDESENAELRARAAEAGLTMSAYLRSCIFEVDDLRTQVKQTLAQMRSAPTALGSAPTVPLQAPATGWRDRIFPRWTMHRSAAHA